MNFISPWRQGRSTQRLATTWWQEPWPHWIKKQQRIDDLPRLPNMNNFIHSVIKCNSHSPQFYWNLWLGHFLLKHKIFTSQLFAMKSFWKNEPLWDSIAQKNIYLPQSCASRPFFLRSWFLYMYTSIQQHLKFIYAVTHLGSAQNSIR